MKAIVQHSYGGPEVLQLEDAEKPQPQDNEVLVRVHTAAIHPGDWLMMCGRPYVLHFASFNISEKFAVWYLFIACSRGVD